MRYKECERVLSVPGSTSFGVVGNVPCNPGLASSFPWLSGHAGLYDKYKVHRLVYRYKNLKGTGSDGNILMSFDYDTLDAAPSTAVQMTQSTAWIDGSPWRIFELHVKPDGRKLFTRAGAVSSSDLKTYDMGRLFIAAEGCADSSDHGYLEVDYDIELYDKAPLDSGVPAAITSLSQFNLSANTGSAPGVIPFDETIVNGLGLTNTSGVFTGFDEGLYLIHVDARCSDGSIEFEVNNTSLSPPAYVGPYVNDSHAGLRYVSISEGDSLRITTTTTGICVADYNRILIQRV
jgi:hypothetical protein